LAVIKLDVEVELISPFGGIGYKHFRCCIVGKDFSGGFCSIEEISIDGRKHGIDDLLKIII
jgi:hypothetical protein